MVKILLKTSYLFVLLIILNSCYESNSVNYVEVNPNTTIPNLKIDFNKPGDTIVVDQGNEVTFYYSSGDKDLIGAKARIDSQDYVVKIINESNIKVVLPVSGFNSGYYNIEVTIFTNSKTGSLADKVGAEGFIFTRKWVMIYMKSSDFKPKVTKAGPEDGLMKLNWSIGVPELVRYYKVSKQLTNKSWQEIGTIENPNQLWINDNFHVGEYANYIIKCKTVNGSEFESNLLSVPQDLPVFQNSGSTNFGEVKLSWDKTKYWKAFKSYRITSNLAETQFINNYNSNSIVFDGATMGKNYQFTLAVVPQNQVDNFDDAGLAFSKQIYAGTGELLPFQSSITGIFKKNLYYKTETTLFKYDIEKNEIVDKIENFDRSAQTFSYSPNGKYYFEGYSNDNQYTFANLENDNFVSMRNFNTVVGHKVWSSKSAVSDNGIAVVVGNDSMYVINLLKGQYLDSRKCDNITGVRISPDGKYIVLQRSGKCTLYKLENKLTQIIWQDGTNELYTDKFEFLPDEPDKFWYKVPFANAHILKLSTMEELANYSFPKESILNFDLHNYRVCLYQSNDFKIIDLKNGDIVKDKIVKDSQANYYNFTLCGNYFYQYISRIKVF
jgi:hypothetical protein